MKRDKTLVYGVLNDNLVILPENLAQAVAADLVSIAQLATYGDARRLVPRFLMVPGLEEDDYDEVPADGDPYDAALTNECVNGDWPPSGATIALDYLSDDLDDIGEERDHFPGLPTLCIDPSTEGDLVQTLERRGYNVRRDDELMERLTQ